MGPAPMISDRSAPRTLGPGQDVSAMVKGSTRDPFSKDQLEGIL